MAGMIDAPPTPTAAPAYTTKDATAVTSTSQGYTPTDYTSQAYTITPQGTVQQQVLDIVKNDSPLMQQASNQALVDMNARGLVNSSLAVGAARDAVIKNALPIATSDANAYNQAMFKTGDAANLALTNTANAKNAASNFEAAAANQSSLANAQLGTNVSLANSAASNDASKLAYGTQAQYNLAGMDSQMRAAIANQATRTQLETANLEANTRMQIANLDAATKTQLATLDGQYRNLLQTNQSASSAFNQVATNLANIANSNLSAQAKQDATATQMNILNQLLQQQAQVAGTDPAAVSSLNLSGYFDWNGTGTVVQPNGTTTTPGSTVTAFGRQLTIGPGVAPNTSQDKTRYAEAQTNNYPYWLGSDGYAYPISTGPGVWPASSFNGTSSGSTTGTTSTGTGTTSGQTTGGADPYALGFTQTNGQWVKNVTSGVSGNTRYDGTFDGPGIQVQQIFGIGFVGYGGQIYSTADAAAKSIQNDLYNQWKASQVNYW